MKLLNAFSVNMPPPPGGSVVFGDITEEQARSIASTCPMKSYIGHADTARVFSEILGIPVEMNRTSVELLPGSLALLGQYSGPRLPEGATQLPEGATIRWVIVGVYIEDAK